VFNTAKLPDRVIECGEKAVENAPNNVTVLIDLAMALLRYRRDTVRARELLERVRQHEISDMVLPFLIACEGVLALEEKKPEQARKLLEESLKLVEPYRRVTALMGAAIDRIYIYLALACAAVGDQSTADSYYRRAEPRLRAFDATDLIERCRAAGLSTTRDASST
jgi:tetratricopeptide (TPR) repeat protein